jgi:hypothetical protein
MKNLIEIIDTGFIITLALIIFICGSIGLYFYKRLSILENSIIEQGKVLQAFIQNYNSHLSKNNIFNSNNKFEKINVSETNSEKDYSQILNNQINNDDDTDDDSDDDIDDDSDDDTDNDSQINNEDNNDNIDDSDDSGDNDDNDDSDDDNIEIDNTNIENLKEKIIDYEFDLKSLNINEGLLLNLDDDIVDSSTKKINILEIDENININDNENNNENSNENTNEISNENKKRNLNKMNVSDLKTLVVAENLIDNENAQKLKKNELLKLLQKN